jgi:glycerol-3-phosphate acyltransferase PlsY
MPEPTTSAGLLGLIALASYLLGSVPFGLVMARLFGLGDLRAIGSGNIGATNVLRSGNRTAAALTALLDGAKGGVAVLIARALAADDAAQMAGLAAFLGHLFPLWIGFRGGKGVATFLGTLLALYWPLGLAACAVWLAMAIVSRYSSVAALMAAATAPMLAVMLGRSELLALTTVLAILVWIRHRPNLARLRAGTETKIGQKG